MSSTHALAMLAALSLATLNLASCSEAPGASPLEGKITVESNSGVQFSNVVVTATTDAVTITDIDVNRGSCPQSPKLFPETLTFGQKAHYVYGKENCDPIEATVHTDLGSATYTFQP